MTVGSLCRQRLYTVLPFFSCRRFSSISPTFVTAIRSHNTFKHSKHNFTRFAQQIRFISVLTQRKEATKSDEEELLELLGEGAVKKLDSKADQGSNVKPGDDNDLGRIEEAVDLPPTPIVEYDWDPLKYLADGLEYLHSFDIPYGFLIMGTVATVRLLLAPIYYKAERGDTNIAANYDENVGWLQRVKEVNATKDRNKIEEVARQYLQFAKEKGIPFQRDQNRWSLIRGSAVILQMIVWLRLAQRYSPGMTTEGMLWFQNLAIPDPTNVLPIIVAPAIMGYILLRTHSVHMDAAKNSLFYLLLICAYFPCFMVLKQMPTALVLCFATNLAISYMFFGLLRIPPIRRLFKLQKIVPLDLDVLRDLRKGIYTKHVTPKAPSPPSPPQPDARKQMFKELKEKVKSKQ